MSRDPIRNELRGLDAWITREPPMDSEPDDDRIIGERDCPYCDGGGTVAACQANDIECQCPGGPDVCLECRASCRCPNCDGDGQI